MSEVACKVLVLGGGPAGYTAAIRCGQLGVPTVLVDEGGLGGVCLREGCIPSKALLAATKTVQHARDLVASGVASGEVRIDAARLVESKDRTVAGLVAGLHELMKANKVKVLRCRGEVLGRGRVVAALPDGPVECRADAVIVATGSAPIDLPLLPVDGDRVLSSSHALGLRGGVPETLAVVGGGYIGLELATVYARLGTRVTVVEMKDQLMPGTDRDLVLVVAQRLKRAGVTVLTDTGVVSADRSADGMVLAVERRGARQEVRADRVLVSVGRRPVTAGAGLAAAGVEVGPGGFLEVDDRMRTRADWLFAAGDVTGAPLLAHKAHAEGEVAAEAAAGHPASLVARVVPAVAFTEPEVATVGLTETAAKARGIEVLRGRFPFAALGRAQAEDAGIGHAKVLADPGSHAILGCGIAGGGAGEVIAAATLAIQKGLTLEDVDATIHSHPTYAEAFQEACRAALGKAIHVVNR